MTEGQKRREYNARYRAANREKMREASRRWYNRPGNADKNRIRGNEWRWRTGRSVRREQPEWLKKPAGERYEDAVKIMKGEQEQPMLMDLRAIAHVLSLGHRTLWRYIKAGTFPKPDVVIGQRVLRWKRDTVMDWLDEQLKTNRGTQGTQGAQQQVDLSSD